MNKNILREYDVRGKYPDDLNEEVANFYGQKYGTWLQKKGYTNIAVGRDIRLSSETLKKSLVEGLLKSGINVIDMGITSTPMAGYASILFHTASLEVTASHNPKDDNGFKMYLKDNHALCGDELKEFYTFLDSDELQEGTGTLEEKNILEDYKKVLFNKISFGSRRIKLVIDPGNGVTSCFIKDIFKDLPCDITYICDEPDGNFPNHHPDPIILEYTEMLRNKVKEIGADFGIGYDGDGDRIGVIDNTGNLIYTDMLMILIWKCLVFTDIQKKTLYDVKCTPALTEVLKEMGIDYIVYKTGAPLTRNKINEEKIPFGGEYSGHIVFTDKYIGVDDGIYATIRLVEMLSHTNHSITEILEEVPEYKNAGEIKLPTPDEIKFKVVDKMFSYYKEKGCNIIDIDGVRIEDKDYAFCFRASNTGPNITFIPYAKTDELLQKIINEVQNKYEEIKKDIQ